VQCRELPLVDPAFQDSSRAHFDAPVTRRGGYWVASSQGRLSVRCSAYRQLRARLAPFWLRRIVKSQLIWVALVRLNGVSATWDDEYLTVKEIASGLS
jgi:hypothetical protein